MEEIMIVTSAAVEVIEHVRELHSIPDDFGVRLFPSRNHEDATTVAIDFAHAPSADDEVSEQHGTLVFVDRDVAVVLADAELDAIRTGTDDGGHPVRLVLRSGGRRLPEA
jgi:Fe-S cluster assembly iron-binding protein IscA